jgi:hypothetical protein
MRRASIKPGQCRKARILGELTTVRVVDVLDPALYCTGQWICKIEPNGDPYLVPEADFGAIVREPSSDRSPVVRTRNGHRRQGSANSRKER